MASISRSELNLIIQKISLSEMSSDTFEFSEDIEPARYKFSLPLRVTPKSGDFYFEVRYDSPGFSMDENFIATSFPGNTPNEEPNWFPHWFQVVENFEGWLSSIRLELAEPDPWTLLREGSILVDQIPREAQGAKFSEEELHRLHQHLESVRDFLYSSVEPTENQIQLIDEKLRYLEESAKRQTKQDWAHTAIGVFFTIAIGLAMAPDQANRLFQMTSVFIKTLFLQLLT